MTEIRLSQIELQDLNIQVLGRKAKERIVLQCVEKGICSRGTAYTALSVRYHDNSNNTHQRVIAEAIKYMRDYFNVVFEWATPTEVEA